MEPGAYIMWDIAPDAGNVTYENFSLNWVSGPRTWTGGGERAIGAPAPIGRAELCLPLEHALIFSGSTRPINTNDLAGLTVPWVTLQQWRLFPLRQCVNQQWRDYQPAGNNTFKGGLAWSSTAAKSWSIASGSELVLDNATTIEVNGDHAIYGGGTLRLKGATEHWANAPRPTRHSPSMKASTSLMAEHLIPVAVIASVRWPRARVRKRF